MTFTAKRLIQQDLSLIPTIAGSLNPGSVSQLVKTQNPVIVEIGANCGQSTIQFINTMPAAKIYCFEPDPRAASRFRKNITHPNVFLFECAVGEYSGHIDFHQSSGMEHAIQSGWDESGSIRKPKNHLEAFPWVTFKNTIRVPIIRLDDWARSFGINQIDFIWADVQGAEKDLICGAQMCLRNTRFLYTEYSNSELYEGQVDLNQIYNLLPQFLLLHKFQGDALFENIYANNKFDEKKLLELSRSFSNMHEFVNLLGLDSSTAIRLLKSRQLE